LFFFLCEFRNRHKRQVNDPKTPDKYKKMSKRCWDGLVRAWRRQLHKHDPPKEEGEEELDLNDDDLALDLSSVAAGDLDLETGNLGI